MSRGYHCTLSACADIGDGENWQPWECSPRLPMRLREMCDRGLPSPSQYRLWVGQRGGGSDRAESVGE